MISCCFFTLALIASGILITALVMNVTVNGIMLYSLFGWHNELDKEFVYVTEPHRFDDLCLIDRTPIFVAGCRKSANTFEEPCFRTICANDSHPLLTPLSLLRHCTYIDKMEPARASQMLHVVCFNRATDAFTSYREHWNVKENGVKLFIRTNITEPWMQQCMEGVLEFGKFLQSPYEHKPHSIVTTIRTVNKTAGGGRFILLDKHLFPLEVELSLTHEQQQHAAKICAHHFLQAIAMNKFNSRWSRLFTPEETVMNRGEVFRVFQGTRTFDFFNKHFLFPLNDFEHVQPGDDDAYPNLMFENTKKSPPRVSDLVQQFLHDFGFGISETY